MKLTPAQKILLCIFFSILLIGGLVRLYYASDFYARKWKSNPAMAVEQHTSGRSLTVDVDGAVLRPGVYRIPGGATRHEALQAAGGRAPGADTSRINLALPVKDREKIFIPSKNDPGTGGYAEAVNSNTGESGSQGMGAKPAPRRMVNINTAGAAELETLPGVGPATAARIIALRGSRGAYRSIEEIMLVKGIGEKKFERLKPWIRTY